MSALLADGETFFSEWSIRFFYSDTISWLVYSTAYSPVFIYNLYDWDYYFLWLVYSSIIILEI